MIRHPSLEGRNSRQCSVAPTAAHVMPRRLTQLNVHQVVGWPEPRNLDAFSCMRRRMASIYGHLLQDMPQ